MSIASRYGEAFKKPWFRAFLAVCVTYLCVGGVVERVFNTDTARLVKAGATLVFFGLAALVLWRGWKSERSDSVQ